MTFVVSHCITVYALFRSFHAPFIPVCLSMLAIFSLTLVPTLLVTGFDHCYKFCTQEEILLEIATLPYRKLLVIDAGLGTLGVGRFGAWILGSHCFLYRNLWGQEIAQQFQSEREIWWELWSPSWSFFIQAFKRSWLFLPCDVNWPQFFKS